MKAVDGGDGAIDIAVRPDGADPGEHRQREPFGRMILASKGCSLGWRGRPG